jgi:hypothetical protein
VRTAKTCRWWRGGHDFAFGVGDFGSWDRCLKCGHVFSRHYSVGGGSDRSQVTDEPWQPYADESFAGLPAEYVARIRYLTGEAEVSEMERAS